LVLEKIPALTTVQIKGETRRKLALVKATMGKLSYDETVNELIRVWTVMNPIAEVKL